MNKYKSGSGWHYQSVRHSLARRTGHAGGHYADELHRKSMSVRKWNNIEPQEVEDLRCNFCGGHLGAIETQKHDNPNFAEFRTCMKCNHQWAKQYWRWLKEMQEKEMQESGVRQLPVVRIGKKDYFVDERLNELRNIKDPNDREKMEGSEAFYTKLYGRKSSAIKKSKMSKSREGIDFRGKGQDMYKWKKGDVVHIRDNASSEYRGAKGVVFHNSKGNDEFVNVSLVSNNGTKAIWAVHRTEIE